MSPRVGARPSPRVEANGTVFYGHPDGETSLVRFWARDVDAPGGRLRVFDRRARLLATAAMLRSGDSLYGELWLPLVEADRLITTLEAPGLRRALRSVHRVVAGRRWTIHVSLLLDPSAVHRELAALPAINRAVQATLYRQYRAHTNPLPSAGLLEIADHLPFLQFASPARELEEQYGIPRSTLAYARHAPFLPVTTGLVLGDTGVRVLATDYAGGDAFRWRSSPDGSRLLHAALLPGGTPVELGFTASRDEMRQRVERWLTETPQLLAPDYRPDFALAVSLDTPEALPTIAAAIDEWNAEYAFPRISLDQAEQIADNVLNLYGTTLPIAKSISTTRSEGDTGHRTLTAVRRRASAASERARGIVAALAGALVEGAQDLATIAHQIDASVPGTLVFNPSPFPRTDLVRLADGSEQIATDVPELGYAFFPHRRGPSDTWIARDSAREVNGRYARVRLDSRSGAIASLLMRPGGLELVRLGSVGLNALDHLRLGDVQRFELPRIGSRLVATRLADGGGAVRTTVTVYDHLPWVDIENDADAAPEDLVSVRFPFSIEQPVVAWEVPVGFEEAAAPIASLAHLRWLRLKGERHSILFRGLDAPYVSVDAAGELRSPAPARRSRYRIALEPPLASPIAPWRFGWQTERLLTAPVSPVTGATLPRFASLLSIDRAGVAALGLKWAEDGRGLILFLQELLGAQRRVSLRAGLLRFGGVRVVDFHERDRGEQLVVDASGVRISLRPRGVTAVRLEDVELNRT